MSTIKIIFDLHMYQHTPVVFILLITSLSQVRHIGKFIIDRNVIIFICVFTIRILQLFILFKTEWICIHQKYSFTKLRNMTSTFFCLNLHHQTIIQMDSAEAFDFRSHNKGDRLSSKDRYMYMVCLHFRRKQTYHSKCSFSRYLIWYRGCN